MCYGDILIEHKQSSLSALTCFSLLLCMRCADAYDWVITASGGSYCTLPSQIGLAGSYAMVTLISCKAQCLSTPACGAIYSESSGGYQMLCRLYPKCACASYTGRNNNAPNGRIHLAAGTCRASSIACGERHECVNGLGTSACCCCCCCGFTPGVQHGHCGSTCESQAALHVVTPPDIAA